jgi:preprotein translocase subunit SecE
MNKWIVAGVLLVIALVLLIYRNRVADICKEFIRFVVDGWKEFTQFLSDVRAEMRKVVTPTRKEVESTTTVVIIAVFIFGLFFLVVDSIFSSGMNWLIHKMGG